MRYVKKKDFWHINCFNNCEVIIVRDGPAPDGKTYIDGRHQIRVAIFERSEDAKQAVEDYNSVGWGGVDVD